MYQLVIIAFTMGALGSFHCAGMCGPLALSLPLGDDRAFTKFTGALVYNGGRVVTYSALGLLLGIIGKSAALVGIQQWLSIAAGALILIGLLVPGKFYSSKGKAGPINGIFIRLRQLLGKLFLKKSSSSFFTIGLLNGLLPCGLVYMALAGALSTGSIGRSILFMAVFGAGTLPMMWSIAFFGNYLGIALRQKVRRVYPYMMAFMACLLILRGMGLGIPYVSPSIVVKERVIQSCCAKP